MICLVFYTANKLTMYVITTPPVETLRSPNGHACSYIFLLERARVVRAPFMSRYRDYLWLFGMLILLGGFGSIAIVGYLSPVVELSRLDGRCRIGLPNKVSFPLLCFDVAVNFLLTGVFFWLLRPVLDFHGLLSVSNWFGGRFSSRVKQSVQKRELSLQHETDGGSLKSAMNKNIRTLLWKCLIGSTLVMLPTVGNMAQFYVMNSRELGWVCLTICTLDSEFPLPHPVQVRHGYCRDFAISNQHLTQHSFLGHPRRQLADHRLRRRRTQPDDSHDAVAALAPVSAQDIHVTLD
jgi:hypothetical protein